MKKIYICAALGLFFASCSTEESANTSIKDVKTVNVVSQASWNTIMTDIENSCTQGSYDDIQEMLDYVETAALANPSFQALGLKEYVSPTVEEIEYLLIVDPAVALSEMNYSTAANYYLNQMLVVSGPWATHPSNDINLSNDDKKLLNFLSYTWGPDKDWDWDKKKPLAFVKGYESNVATAIILSVSVKQAEKVENK